MHLKRNYYFSSLFWSTAAKILNAILGFISVPMLLFFYGKSDYGVLSIAMACNGYMHLLDLGMNTGAVKFFSQWLAEQKRDLIFRIARTNITFYFLISIVNIIGLLLLALFGELLFSISHSQFLQLRSYLYILAVFSAFNWVTTAFNQLLIADKQIAFTMQVQCVQILLKGVLIFIVFTLKLSLTTYFFYLTFIVSLAIIPYCVKCKADNLIDSLKPAKYWAEFRVVLIFSLSIFILSLFQVTSTQSRPIILSIFAVDGADSVANFRILEVVPQLIIMIGGTFSGIFLPQAAEMVAQKDNDGMKTFVYKWTSLTTFFICLICFPFIISASEILSAYVGKGYDNLSPWLIIWCVLILVQMHSTPANSLIMAHGKIKLLVYITGVSCFISILVNIFLCKYFGVGSAILGYSIYILIVLISNYTVLYKKYLDVSNYKIFKAFLFPTFLAAICIIPIVLLPNEWILINMSNERIELILLITIRSILWCIPFILLSVVFKIISLKQIFSKER